MFKFLSLDRAHGELTYLTETMLSGQSSALFRKVYSLNVFQNAQLQNLSATLTNLVGVCLSLMNCAPSGVCKLSTALALQIFIRV